mmetsp:Transcript_3507/g.7090  ORF Transcript_3507/g.7090 Transcript_3507/m.7090 type:complete len:162 (+) Transcript_3507:137-622(+)
MSMDVADHVGMFDQEDAEGKGREEEEGTGKGKAEEVKIAIINRPVPFWWHTIMSNVQGIVSAAPSCILILLMKHANEWLVKNGEGGFFGDMHVVRCTGCLLMVDACILIARRDCKLTKKNLMIAFPCRMAFMVGFSDICGWKIGAATPTVATLAFAFGEWC